MQVEPLEAVKMICLKKKLYAPVHPIISSPELNSQGELTGWYLMSQRPSVQACISLLIVILIILTFCLTSTINKTGHVRNLSLILYNTVCRQY